jgi:3-oxoacyl-[acyl-carrier protein] reductase
MAKKSVADRHVIVSGGSRGLGLALVRALIARGDRVSTFGREATPEIEELVRRHSSRLLFHGVDAAESPQLHRFVDAATERFGPPRALVNNSATAVDGVLATLPEIEISRMVRVNLEGAILLTRLCLRRMLVDHDGGRVINISSIVGSRGFTGLSVYSATKAGLDGFTRSLAREVGRRGITVNSVAPGYMESRMSEGLEEADRNRIVGRTPLGRLALFEDVVPVVLFLLSKEAAFITGQTIAVDGGSSV